jgi:hypothetical protein
VKINIESFKDSKVSHGRGSSEINSITRNRCVGNYHGFCIIQYRLDIIKSTLVSAEPNRVENIDDCCNNDHFALRTPTSITNIPKIISTSNRTLYVNYAKKPIPHCSSKMTMEKNVTRRFTTRITNAAHGRKMTTSIH